MKTLKNFINALAILGIVSLAAVSCDDKDTAPDPTPDPAPAPELSPITIGSSKISCGIDGDYYVENGDVIAFRTDMLDLATADGKKISCSNIRVVLDGHEIGSYATIPFKTGSYRLDGISHGEHSFKLATTLSCEGYADTEYEFDSGIGICVFYEKPVAKMKAIEYRNHSIERIDADGAIHQSRYSDERELLAYETISIEPDDWEISYETGGSYKHFYSVFIRSEIDHDAINFDGTVVSQTIEWSDEKANKGGSFVISDYDWDSKVPVTCSIVSQVEGVHEGIDVSFTFTEYYKYVSSAW